MQWTRVYPIGVIVLPKEMYVGGVRQVYTEGGCALSGKERGLQDLPS